MAIRYYPSFRIKPNLFTRGAEFLLNGAPYSGQYYQTYDGKFFSGPNPILGPNEPLYKLISYTNDGNLPQTNFPRSLRDRLAETNRVQVVGNDTTEPTPYHPTPLQEDYNRGYFDRYFVKKINERGYIKEISAEEYSRIQDGSATYDVTYYQIEKIIWKLTGPLDTVRLSQYDIRAGIIDTNKRLVEATDARFLGLKAYIGEAYAKFSRPT